MIREVLPDFLALAVFTTGGGFCALLFLKRGALSTPKPWSLALDFGLGVLVGVAYVLLTEVFFGSVLTPYTAFSFLVGVVGVLAFFKESTPRKRQEKRAKKPKKRRLAKKQAPTISQGLVSPKPYSCYRNHRFSFRLRRRRK